jgi:hypothetical protein
MTPACHDTPVMSDVKLRRLEVLQDLIGGG